MDGLGGHQVAHLLGSYGDVQNLSDNDFMPEVVTLQLWNPPSPPALTISISNVCSLKLG
jgi:hypothetical protein